MAGKKTTTREKVIKRVGKSLKVMDDALGNKRRLTNQSLTAAKYILEIALKHEEAVKLKELSYEEKLRQLKEEGDESSDQ